VVATIVVVAACAPKDVDIAFSTFSGSALFLFWESSGGGACSWVGGEPVKEEESCDSFLGLGSGVFCFFGSGRPSFRYY
jgi:hypothetical protein